MTFANPLALYGLWLTAIPIAIHLFNLRKAKKVYFSNVAALEAIQTSTNSINRLKSLLMLLFRVLFIVFLTLAFAQPIPKNSPSIANTSPKVAFVLDNSYSMQNEKAAIPLLNLAASFIQKVTEVYPPATNFFFENNGLWQEMDAIRLREKIANISYHNIPKTLPDKIKVLAKANQKYTGKTEIFIISDFQKNSSGSLTELCSDTTAHYYIVPLKADSYENIAVDSLWLQTPYLQAHIPNTLIARIRNYGQKTVEKLAVSLWVNQTQTGIASTDVPANGYADVELPILVKANGRMQGSVEILDAPLSFDNKFYFSASIAPAVVVSHIYEKKSVYIPAVYSDSAFFDYAGFEVSSIGYARLASSDLIILENITAPAQSLISEVQRALERGASVVIIPSAQNTSSHWEALGAFFRSQSSPQNLPFDVPDEKNPFFYQVFEQLPQASLMPQGSAILIPLAAQTLLALRDGTPFITVKTIAKGKLYQFAAPLDKTYTDLHLNGLFVPVMFKIAFSALAVNEQIAYRFGAGYAVLPLKGLNKNDLFSLGKAGYIPEQRASASGLILALPTEGIAAGTYPVVRIRDDSVFSALSLNHPREESEIKCYDLQEIKAAFAHQKNVTVLSEASIRNFSEQIRQAKAETPLWKVLILMALICLAAETALVWLSKAVYR